MKKLNNNITFFFVSLSAFQSKLIINNPLKPSKSTVIPFQTLKLIPFSLSQCTQKHPFNTFKRKTSISSLFFDQLELDPPLFSPLQHTYNTSKACTFIYLNAQGFFAG
jgi:hypothetical protein